MKNQPDNLLLKEQSCLKKGPCSANCSLFDLFILSFFASFYRPFGQSEFYRRRR